MIRESFGDDEEVDPGFDIKTMFMMAVATSIDALAVGITFVAVPVELIDGNNITNVLLAVLMIAVITCIISMAGVKIGHIFGMRYKSGSEIMGGTILVFIGLRTLIGYLDKSNTLSDADTIFGMLIPLLGTVLGAAFVYARKNSLPEIIRNIMVGCSLGIMFSISVWGMMEPATRGVREDGKKGIILSAIVVVPYVGFLFLVFASFCGGVILQFVLDRAVPHTHAYAEITEGPRSQLKSETKIMLAEVIHHIPEGVALGAVYAGHFMKTDWISASTALVLAIAIAVQNFPEALLVSMPVREKGTENGKSFFMGIVSGIPVPMLGIFTVIIVVLFPEILPMIMAVAGGAMIYTTVEEMPQMTSDNNNDKGTLAFIIGFALVMLKMLA